ncbi:hypothetical protein JIG36_46955 [Actinoplanes sp. LDG1-06]|uniref:Uncharacterized protein n=1 Tax=Paractinoplanes ovalisporus TaxID=2810368 RepID=A0ABS2ATM4_9ACTN|nr:hypothetical protein [Actinoplanes ovalisporus]MBM2623065.1 hypothetical protein [Actinoplanes ovalisporus]
MARVGALHCVTRVSRGIVRTRFAIAVIGNSRNAGSGGCRLRLRLFCRDGVPVHRGPAGRDGCAGCGLGIGRCFAQLAESARVAHAKPPAPVAFMHTAKFISVGRIVAGFSPVTHFGKFGRGEQLKLPHGNIIPRAPMGVHLFDHANVELRKQRNWYRQPLSPKLTRQTNSARRKH